jgi:ketosteroid isomerase-like protein
MNMEARMDRSTAQAWLDAYVAAWKSYDRAAVAALFAEDATYRYHPFDPEDETLRGREAIVSSWLEPEGNASGRDAEGTYDARYEVYAVDDDRVVAVGWSSYFSDASQSTLERRYHNVFLMEFDATGRCRAFVEYYMKEPEPAG